MLRVRKPGHRSRYAVRFAYRPALICRPLAIAELSFALQRLCRPAARMVPDLTFSLGVKFNSQDRLQG
jgi:hypothetical protein